MINKRAFVLRVILWFCLVFLYIYLHICDYTCDRDVISTYKLTNNAQIKQIRYRSGIFQTYVWLGSAPKYLCSGTWEQFFLFSTSCSTPGTAAHHCFRGFRSSTAVSFHAKHVLKVLCTLHKICLQLCCHVGSHSEWKKKSKRKEKTFVCFGTEVDKFCLSVGYSVWYHLAYSGPHRSYRFTKVLTLSPEVSRQTTPAPTPSLILACFDPSAVKTSFGRHVFSNRSTNPQTKHLLFFFL